MNIRIILLLFVLVSSLQAEYRIWTDIQGNVLEAEFVCMAAGKVVLRDYAGKEYKMAPNSLSAEDQRYVEGRIPPELDINVSKTTDNAAKGGGSLEYVRCIATIRQADTRSYSSDLTVYLLVIAEDTRKDAFIIVDRKEKTFSLDESSDRSVQLNSTRSTFHRSGKSGKKYSGYLVVVKDKHGQTIAIKSNRAIFEEQAESLVSRKK